MKKILEKIKNLTRVQKIIAICIGVVVIVSVALVCVVNAYMDKINFIEDEFEYLTEESLQEELDIGTITNTTVVGSESTESENEEIDFEFKEGINNILLIGADTKGTNGYGRSDSMIILTLDTNTKTIKMTSVLRDNYVDIPGYSKNKLNASYAYGGPDLLMETLGVNFGIKLEKYAYVDFDGFEDIINILGGVDITLTAKETSRVFGTTKEAGEYHLSGKEALNYVRIRKIDSDFGRTSRQRTLLTTVYNNFKNKNITELITICTELLPYINTNLTKTEILDLLKTAVSIGNLEIEQHVIPTDGTYRFATTSKGASIIDLDCAKNAALLYEFIYNEEFVENIEDSTEEETQAIITIN